MKYFTILFSAILLVACVKSKETKTKSKTTDSIAISQEKTNKNNDSTNITVEKFNFPEEIKECSCYFATNKTDFEEEKYIYADDVAKTAYMKINGEKLKMSLLSSSDLENDEINKEIENENYKITIKAKKIKNEETLLFQGNITIEKADGNSITLPIYGECGC